MDVIAHSKFSENYIPNLLQSLWQSLQKAMVATITKCNSGYPHKRLWWYDYFPAYR